MAKLAALLAALILVANAAAALRTTTEDCSRQIQWRDLSDCMRYLREQLLNEEAYNKLDNRPEDYLDQCCGQLRMMSEWCRCDGLKSDGDEPAAAAGAVVGPGREQDYAGR